jgi:hypothetical protein
MPIDFPSAALLAAMCAAGACARGADLRAFRGVYSMGPDLSAFRPCGSEEDWYVAPSPASPGLELQRRTVVIQDAAPPGGMRTKAPPGADAGGFHRAYVELHGDTVALTGGPEVGRYTRELRPTRVLVVRHPLRTECP